MDRVTLRDFMVSRGPQAIGLCTTDTSGCAAAVNAATQRLMFSFESGDAGLGAWGFAELAFDVDPSDPLITLPRGFSRAIAVDVCSYPVSIHNQWFEFLRWGSGKQPKSACSSPSICGSTSVFDRGIFPVAHDVVPPNQKIAAYLTDSADVGKRTLIGGLDANGQIIRELDGLVQVQGTFLELAAPFVQTSMVLSKVTAIQKDITLGDIAYYAVDTVTADQTFLVRLAAGETAAAFRRYQLTNLPASCCNLPASTTVQVLALCKTDYVPVVSPTDFLCVPNLEALIEECQSVRYSGVDQPSAAQLALVHHRNAIRFLQGQSVHEYGRTKPAVGFAPFGGARLSAMKIGYMT